jgi:hypothetical protein
MHGLRTRVKVAFAVVALSVVAREGVALARTAEWAAGGSRPGAFEPAPAGAARGQDRGGPPDPAASSASQAPLCHISHHPRDGMPTEQHACPLLVAALDDAPPRS